MTTAADKATCTTQIPDVVGLEQQVLTVGRHFYLNCQRDNSGAGAISRDFDFSKAFVVLDESNKNSIKVFKTEARSATSFDVDLVLYVAGDIQTTNFKISDGVHEIELGEQKFKVKSVLEKNTEKQPEKPPEPFGYMISQLNWPWQYSALALTIVILSLATVIAIYLNKLKWRRRLERLKNFDSPVLADSQFYKQIRKAEKNEFPINDLENILKTYVLRTYKVPIFELSNRQIIAYIKKTKPRLKSERRQIYNILKDIEILKKDSQLEKRKKFVEQCYRVVDQAEDLKQRGLL